MLFLLASGARWDCPPAQAVGELAGRGDGSLSWWTGQRTARSGGAAADRVNTRLADLFIS